MTPFISSRVRKLDVGISGYTDSDSVLNVTGKVSIGTEIDIVPYDNVNNGTLRLEGSAGTLFSISNNLTSGSIFSVNDASGIPSFDVNADGTVLLAPFGSSEYVGIGNNAPKSKLDVTGSVIVGDNTNLTGAAYDLHVNGTTPGDITGLRVSQETVSFDVVSWSPSFPSTNNANTVQLISSGKFDIRSDGTPAQIRFYLNGRTSTGYQHALIESNTLVVGSYDRSSSLTTNTKVGNISGPRGSGTDIGSGGLNIIGGESTGTASGGPIKFSTSSAGESSGSTVNTPTERMIITSDGNVGIGISDPTVPLFVQSDSPSAIFKIASVEQTTGFHFAFGWADNTLYHRIRTSGGLNDGFIIENIDAKVQQNFAADGNWSLINDATTSLLTSPSGYVGINGTTDPNVELHILTTPAAAGTSGRIGFGDISNYRVAQIEAYRQSGSYAGSLIFRTQEENASTTEGLERLRITSSGNVGIGTSTPQSKLDVDGDIIASGDLDLDSGGTYSTTIQSVTPTANRTISFPDQTGTVGLVAGSTGMIQYNDAGKLAASGNFVYANGNVGIGTQSPTESLDISGTQNKYIQITSTNSQRTGLVFSNASPGVGKIYYNHGDNTLRIETNSLERVRIDSTGQIQSNGLGSAASPALSFTTDTNTGIYSPGADQLAISTGGTGRLFVDASGDVGLSTNTPDVFGRFYTRNIGLSSSGSTALQINAAAGSNAVIDVGVNSVRTAGFTSNTTETIITTLGATPLLVGTNSLERLRITSTGNVGIGTSSPLGTLSVGNQDNVSGQVNDIYLSGDKVNANGHFARLMFRNSTQSGGSTASIRGERETTNFGTALTFYTQPIDSVGDGFERLRIDSAGNVGIGTQSPAARLHVEGADLLVKNGTGVPYIVLAGRDTDGRSEIAFRNNTYTANNARFVGLDNQLALEVAGSERLRIISNGNIGIGTESPTEKLEVSGNIKLSSNGTGASASSYELLFYGTSSGSVQKNQAKIQSSPWANNTNAGVLKFFTNSSTNVVTERMRIDGGGNVGIATTNPQYKLDIVGTLRVSETTRIGDVIDIVPYDNLNNGTLSFEGSAGQLFSITNNLTSGSIFAVNDVSGIPSLDVDADGTVKVAEFGGDVFFTGLSTDTVFVGTNNNTNTNSSRLVVNGSISETVGGIQYPVVSQVDIGTDPNQIPLNQFLGTMAFADFPFLQSGTSTDGASASVTINAESTDLYSQIASYATDVTFDIINLGIGREIKLYLRNTNASARTMTIRASSTNTGATAVNLAPGAGTMGAASESTVILAATSGTTLIYVANIGGNIVGGILA